MHRYVILFLILATMISGLLPNVTDITTASADRLGRGINLGNALEAEQEGWWGVTLQEEYFRLVKAAGFDHVRVPIAWSHHTDHHPPYQIDETFFQRIDWVLEQSHSNGLKVVIDAHHYHALNSNPAGEKNRFLAIWRQIAERYHDRGPWLYFELLNEPQEAFNADPETWNSLLAEALSVIRASNPTRKVILGSVHGYDLNTLPLLRLPSDPNLIITFHYYGPIEFTHQNAHWIYPSPPLGQTWHPDDPALNGENWSWGTTLQWVANGLQVTYQYGYAGLYMHSFPIQGPALLRVKADRNATGMEVNCKSPDGDTFFVGSSFDLIAHQARLLTVPVACHNAGDIIIMSSQPQTLVFLDLTLIEDGKERPLLTTAAERARSTMAWVADWARSRGLEVYLGEFGAYSGDPSGNGPVDLASRIAWTRMIRAEAERQGMSWAYWEFGSGFGLYDINQNRWRAALLQAVIPSETRIYLPLTQR
ncbi:glycoside hydrolase family 5 protein [Chloroflexus sp.]|uniref:glycoside hydrolase family 5 protein n=1 Tax=Chloroflexus sp. TaxID=1904827 RepID=UPI00262A6272|nr:glycoside hydrolase family 5 protein [uncultured Chloroflexus sp.]